MESFDQEYDPYSSSNSFMGKTDSKGVYIKDRLKMIKEKIVYYAVKILPAVKRFVVFILFYLKRIIKGAIKIALEQLKF